MYKIVQSSRLYEQIVKQIEDSIERGDLKEGDQLPAERELALQFGVSRTAVREAVKALREKGLVEAYPGRGTFITSETSNSIRLTFDRMIKSGPRDGTLHLVEVREILEPEIAALAAKRVTEENLNELREAIANHGWRKDRSRFLHRSRSRFPSGPGGSGRESSDFVAHRFHRRRFARTAAPHLHESREDRSAASITTSGFLKQLRITTRPEHGTPCARTCDKFGMIPEFRSMNRNDKILGHRREANMASLGFVGLGVMGGELVNRLISKGHTVTGYNRTKSKAEWLIKAGMKWADSPRAVTTSADIMFSMVTNSAALEAIVEGPEGILAGLRCRARPMWISAP